jgi:drug/metabolite transporter (DMT)-like permease
MSKEKKHLFDEPKNVSRLLLIFFAALVLLLVPDLFHERHTIFAWEEWPEFYPVFGFVACVLLVLLAKYVLRPLVKREEDYYDR